MDKFISKHCNLRNVMKKCDTLTFVRREGSTESVQIVFCTKHLLAIFKGFFFFFGVVCFFSYLTVWHVLFIWFWILVDALIPSRHVLGKPRIRVGNFLFLTNIQHATPVVKQGEIDDWGEMFDIPDPAYNGMFLVFFFKCKWFIITKSPTI